MAKRSKVTLTEYAKSAKVSVRDTSYSNKEVIYTTIRNIAGKSNEEVEKFVIDNIINHSDHNLCPEYQLLEDFFKEGNNLEKVGYFYDNLESVKRHQYHRGSQIIYAYCKNVLKGRLREDLEKKFLAGLWGTYRGDSAAYKYAKYVIRGRLDTESEKGCNNLNYINFLVSKGINIEGALMGNVNLSYNFYKINWFLPDSVHNFMIASHLGGDRTATIYFKQRKKDDRMIRNRLLTMDRNKTVGEIVEDLK